MPRSLAVRLLASAAFAAPVAAMAQLATGPAEDFGDRQMDEARVICDGAPIQGGFLICTTPLADGPPLAMNGGAAQELNQGYAFFAIARDAEGTAEVRGHGLEPYTADIGTREFDIQRIDGLPDREVAPRTPEDEAKVAADWELKQQTWEHRAEGAWWLDGFRYPLEREVRQSGVYGSQRILNGEPNNPHMGIDYAAAEGEPILAPAGGEVALADPDMYFEGGLVVLDHGAGVMSVFMHMSDIAVEQGQTILAGDTIGAVGDTGRATGAHLHWGIRVRGDYIDPELAMAFDPAESDVLRLAENE